MLFSVQASTPPPLPLSPRLTWLLARREKKHRKCHFDLLPAVREAEYSKVIRPIDPETKRPLEPAHRFEVTIEGDSISQAK